MLLPWYVTLYVVVLVAVFVPGTVVPSGFVLLVGSVLVPCSPGIEDGPEAVGVLVGVTLSPDFNASASALLALVGHPARAAIASSRS